MRRKWWKHCERDRVERTRRRKLEEDREKGNQEWIQRMWGWFQREGKLWERRKKGGVGVQVEDGDERKQNNLLVKIGLPWFHFKASLMILISWNGTLCSQTKKKEWEQKESGIRIIKRGKRVVVSFSATLQMNSCNDPETLKRQNPIKQYLVGFIFLAGGMTPLCQRATRGECGSP